MLSSEPHLIVAFTVSTPRLRVYRRYLKPPNINLLFLGMLAGCQGDAPIFRDGHPLETIWFASVHFIMLVLNLVDKQFSDLAYIECFPPSFLKVPLESAGQVVQGVVMHSDLSFGSAST